MKLTFKISIIASLLCLVVFAVVLAMGYKEETGIPLILFFLLLAIGVRAHQKFKSFSFTILIFAAVTVSMYYPDYFKNIGNFQLKSLIVPLLQLIMFGMGTAMSLKDFSRVVKMPKGVFVGLICQFSIMPILGFSIASIFGFSAEIAAGVVLIGCSPSGLASNVMAYLAKANLALSVTLTAVSTLLAPLMTPLLMKVFADQFVPIDFWSMMLSIIKIVILPIIVGLIFNRLFHGKAVWLDKTMPILSMAGIAIIIAIITAAGRDSLLSIGIFLTMAAILHNLAGYLLGYWGCRILKMNEQDCRTIALEVGMQNGGLASGIALEMGKVSTVGLAPAIFGPWMNISGSSLATWWRDKNPITEGETLPDPDKIDVVESS
ncbi:bile acid:sodium symporter family protein [Fulvivirgaceae bacterium BMA10]|uniref:Bile acid:sodium symporter family protein n=1 Tax=Splendidivirga corallicola TaxID=3051826 RepID=A0ABT8KUC0_9BACT|nr:bile acid:sodium symporter family protein [Fulvivirgaceae bacterium BMA10]